MLKLKKKMTSKKIIAGALIIVFGLSFVSCNKTIKRNPLEKLDNKIVEQIKTPAELEAEKKLAGTDNNNTTGTDNNNIAGYIFQSLFDISKLVLLVSASVIIGVFAVRLCAGAIAYYYM
jgi:hypothetical protein